MAFGISFMLYLFVLQQILGEETDEQRFQNDFQDVHVEEVKKQMLYTWFNTNPIHVLKSSLKTTSIPAEILSPIPYIYGKEFLLKPDDTWGRLQSIVEHEFKDFKDLTTWWMPCIEHESGNNSAK